MNTITIKIDKKNIRKEDLGLASNIIKSGGVVAFPTETVYGLGADGLNSRAVKKIFKAKGRPADNPLILHVSNREQLLPLVEEVSDQANACIDKFWPGALTILFKRSKLVPDIVTAGLDSVAIRMPDNEIALKLIEVSETPIAAPSANISGKPSPTSFNHVKEDMYGKIEMIIDGGNTGIGLESTVLDLSGESPMILRPGGITIEELREVLPDVLIDPALLDEDSERKPKSPGQKYRHYAPKSEMVLFNGETKRVVDEINKRKDKYVKEGKRVGIMCTDETRKLYKNAIVISLGSKYEEVTIAQNLFFTIRKFDELNVDIILAESVEMSNLGSAIMNRLKKAASGKIIEV